MNAPGPAAGLIIESPGWLTTLQDRGRRGYATFGVPGGGPVDPVLAGAMNRSVGNDHSAVLLETAGGLVVRADSEIMVACSAHLAPMVLRAGQRLHIEHPSDRNFDYLAVAGGLQVDTVLGSSSHDTLSGIGPARLEPGARLVVGRTLGPFSSVDQLPGTSRLSDRLRVWPGPHLAMFASGAFEHFCCASWTVQAPVNRIAVRLSAGSQPGVERIDPTELESIGLVLGAVQVHPDGAAMVMSADHPTTGGYPVIGIVDHDDVAMLAQIRPGGSVRFGAVGPERNC